MSGCGNVYPIYHRRWFTRDSRESPPIDVEAIARALDPKARRGSDGNWNARCPCHDDREASLSLARGDKVGLVLFCHAGCSSKDVLAAIRGRGLLNGEHHPAQQFDMRTASAKPNKAKPIKPPANAGLPDCVDTTMGKPSARFPYRDETGALLFCVARYETANGKEIRPWTHNGTNWMQHAWPQPRPLYAIDSVTAKANAKVVIVEGEKCADSLQAALGDSFVVTTWCGGAQAVKHTDWSPLKGRDVTVWPDADKAGRKAAQDIVRLVAGAKVLLVDDKPEGWDCADAVAEGWTTSELQTFLEDRVGQMTATNSVPRTQTQSTNLTIIRAGELHQIVDKIESVLAESGLVYQRDRMLVHVIRAAELPTSKQTQSDIERDPAQPVIADIKPEALRVLLSRLMPFACEKTNGRRVSCDPPAEHVRALCALGTWNDIPPLRGIATSPLMRADGSIGQVPGYDSQSGLLLTFDGNWPRVPEHPSREDAIAAAHTLLKPFAEFPFESEASESSLLAAILTRLVRKSMPNAPVFYCTAPEAGSGKGLLTDCVNLIASGFIPAKRPFPFDSDEMRKTLTTSLHMGDGMLVFDNVPRASKLHSAVLDAAVTSGIWVDRLLGENRNICLPFDLTIMVTGNNIQPTGDSVRRSLRIELVPECERPETRQFEIPDLHAYLRQHRKKLVTAALCLLRAHYVAGQPQCNLLPMGSFEAWSKLVRAPLVWLGLADPVSGQAQFSQADEDRESLIVLLKELQAAFANRRFLASDVFESAYGIGASGRLRAALEAMLILKKDATPNARTISWLLKAHHSRVTAGWVLRMHNKSLHENANTYSVECK